MQYSPNSYNLIITGDGVLLKKSKDTFRIIIIEWFYKVECLTHCLKILKKCVALYVEYLQKFKLHFHQEKTQEKYLQKYLGEYPTQTIS